MTELHEQANRLREENERLRTRLEAGWAEQSREPPCPFPLSRPGKGKEVAAPDDINLSADDELSFGSSPLPRRSPSPNAAEAQSKKRPPRRSSRSVSVARRRCGENPAGTNDRQRQLTNMCLTGLGASHRQYHSCTRP